MNKSLALLAPNISLYFNIKMFGHPGIKYFYGHYVMGTYYDGKFYLVDKLKITEFIPPTIDEYLERQRAIYLSKGYRIEETDTHFDAIYYEDEDHEWYHSFSKTYKTWSHFNGKTKFNITVSYD